MTGDGGDVGRASDAEVRLRRVRWRSRRGMRELDLILMSFVATHYAALSPAEQETYGELLGLEDPQLYAWLSGRERPPDGRLAALVAHIRAVVREQGLAE